MPEKDKGKPKTNPALMEKIRERYEYCVDSWRDVREAARIDMCYVIGDPWSSTPELSRERDRRKKASRPCLSLDELGQYLNQRIGDVRSNKRAIKVSPWGDGADEKTAELRSNVIRRIESDSKAQAAYTTAFEGALQRGYGFFRIDKAYVDPMSMDMELLIKRIPNPDSVYIDPDFKEADASDMRYAFVVEEVPKETYKARWSDAEEIDFPEDAISLHPNWVREDSVQIAEYWAVEEKTATLLVYGDPFQPSKGVIGRDNLKGAKVQDGLIVFETGMTLDILTDRKTQIKEIYKRITNGIQILEETEWEGQWIPIIPVFGKEVWYESPTGSKRIFESLIRKAREAQLLFNYYASCEQEVIGQIPKIPWIGYEGQFGPEWETANTVPKAYLQVKATLPDVTGATPLPLPTRNVWEPPIQALNLGKQDAKRSIQNSMGMYNASVGRTDSAGKSGVAIKALDQQSDQGNYHFLDNHDRALEHAGRILDDMFPYVYDTPRQIGVKDAQDKDDIVTVNAPSTAKNGSPQELRLDKGKHVVSISVGPSYQTQREEASDFMQGLSQVPEIYARVADLDIKMRQLGPYGDEMAKRLTPADVLAAEKVNPQQLQQQLQQSQAMIETMKQQLEKLTQERESKVLEIESKEKIALAEIESNEQIKAVEFRLAAEKLKLDEAKLQLDSNKLGTEVNMRLLEAELEPLKAEMEALRQPNPPLAPTREAPKPEQPAAPQPGSEMQGMPGMQGPPGPEMPPGPEQGGVPPTDGEFA